MQGRVHLCCAATLRWILQWLHHKTDFALTSFPFIRKPMLCRLGYDKNIEFFIYLIFYHREIVKLDHFLTLFLNYANTVL
jgi:hypothetical protein